MIIESTFVLVIFGGAENLKFVFSRIYKKVSLYLILLIVSQLSEENSNCRLENAQIYIMLTFIDSAESLSFCCFHCSLSSQ